MSGQHQQDSPMSTPVSVQANSLIYSDVESIVSLDGVSDKENNSDSRLVHPEFAFSDGNIELQTKDQLFWIHEFQLKKFSKLAQLIQEARVASPDQNFAKRIKISCDASGIDFANTLQVVYASVIQGPSQFDKDVLASALRIATTYEYAELREFAMAGLEKANLTAIDRIRFSDEFVLPSWEKPAFMELCQRQEAITPSEAKVLGMDRFVEIARIREAEQRHQLVGSFVKSVKTQCLPEVDNKAPSGVSVPSSLPQCKCQTSHGCCGCKTRCKLHDVAPQILAECQSLVKQRDTLRESLNKVTTVLVSQESKARSQEIVGVDGLKIGNTYISLENELERATWIRPVQTS